MLPFIHTYQTSVLYSSKGKQCGSLRGGTRDSSLCRTKYHKKRYPSHSTEKPGTSEEV